MKRFLAISAIVIGCGWAAVNYVWWLFVEGKTGGVAAFFAELVNAKLAEEIDGGRLAHLETLCRKRKEGEKSVCQIAYKNWGVACPYWFVRPRCVSIVLPAQLFEDESLLQFMQGLARAPCSPAMNALSRWDADWLCSTGLGEALRVQLTTTSHTTTYTSLNTAVRVTKTEQTKWLGK